MESGLKFPKPRPHLLRKQEQRAALLAEDKRQRKVCKLRSGGQCEIVIVSLKPEASALITKRCTKRALHNHHLLGGHGRRNDAESIRAEHRLDTCARHHSELHHHLLEPVDREGQYDALKVQFYERREW